MKMPIPRVALSPLVLIIYFFEISCKVPSCSAFGSISLITTPPRNRFGCPSPHQLLHSAQTRSLEHSQGFKLNLDISGGGDGGTSLFTSFAATATPLLSSVFAYGGNVPIWQALGLNGMLFAALGSKLNKMLTPEGLAHSLALGTLLWSTLGWRGWSLCVLYLFFGQAVTKIRFEEKQKKGIAEGRGGQRGPENVW